MKNEKIASAIKKSKTLGVIVSLILIICGILIFTTPVGSGIIFSWTMLATFTINGIFRIIRYFTLPKETRNGWLLADGIISAFIGVLILSDIIAKPLGATLGMIGGLGFVVGFYEIIIGINQLCTSGAVKAIGGSMGWIIFIGILNILCGLFVINHPIISYFALETLFGIYLCIAGFSTFVECVCITGHGDNY